MITPSFALTATERVLPKLALDFTIANLDPRITFTRTGATATCVNSNGFIEIKAADTPRFDFNPVTLVCKGLLIEESRGNLILHSQDFASAAWTRTNATIGTSTNSPEGISNGQFLAETTTNGVHRTFVTSSISVANAVSYTLSIYVKGNNRSYIRLGDGNVAGSECFFDISNGTVFSTGAAATATSIVDAGNGWYRCSVTYTTTSTFAAPALFISTDGTTISYAGNVNNGVYIWGAQLEAGAFATSYIPTTTTALTRNADVATMTGTNFSDWYSATEGSLVGDSTFIGSGSAGSNRIVQIDDNTESKRIVLSDTGTGARMIVTDTTAQVDMSVGYGTVPPRKGAVAYKLNNCIVAANGNLSSPDTSATIPTVDRMHLGGASAGSVFGAMYLRKIFYYPQRLTNAELQAFTK
jgi:hypothetical protein